jgi:hypothetical protein
MAAVADLLQRYHIKRVPILRDRKMVGVTSTAVDPATGSAHARPSPSAWEFHDAPTSNRSATSPDRSLRHGTCCSQRDAGSCSL